MEDKNPEEEETIDWTTMDFCFSQEEFLLHAAHEFAMFCYDEQQNPPTSSCSSKQTVQKRSSNCLICASDDEWTNENLLFQAIHSGNFFYPKEECLLPHTRLDGESVCRRIFLDLFDVDSAAEKKRIVRITFEKERGIGSILCTQFEAWTYTLTSSPMMLC